MAALTRPGFVLAAFTVIAGTLSAVLLATVPSEEPKPEPGLVASLSSPASLRPTARPPLETPWSRGFPQPLVGYQDGSLFAAVAEAPQPDDSVLVVTLGPPSRTAGHMIVWTQDSQVKTQFLPAGAQEASGPPDGRLQRPSSAVIDAAQQMRAGQRELGIVFDVSPFGSGSPVARFALLRLEDEEWRLVWEAADEPEWRGSHGRVELPQGDLSELVVRSDSWQDGADELSNVLHESNAGPHREFVDMWVREGDQYVLSRAETVPSAYATLVEFLYALGTGDDARAEQLVTDAELIARAREFGMDGAVGKDWLIACRDSPDCGVQTGPIGFDSMRTRSEPASVVFFQKQDGRWLISDVREDERSKSRPRQSEGP